MSERTVSSVLRDQLFSEGGESVFAVLDGESMPDCPHLLWEERAERVCLRRGNLEPERARAAPWLVHLTPEAPVTDRLLAEGWGNHWGIFAVGSPGVDLIKARSHFRSLTRARLPDGRAMHFKFYDPRVLRIYLPTCNAEELRQFFGPMTAFVLEDDPPDTVVRYRVHRDALQRESLPLLDEKART